MRGAQPGADQPAIVLGLVFAALLTSVLLGLRGLMMFPVEPVPTEHQPSTLHDSGQAHEHLEGCPLCYVQAPLPALVPELGLPYRMGFGPHLWVSGSLPREELLKATAARGPPRLLRDE